MSGSKRPSLHLSYTFDVCYCTFLLSLEIRVYLRCKTRFSDASVLAPCSSISLHFEQCFYIARPSSQ